MRFNAEITYNKVLTAEELWQRVRAGERISLLANVDIQVQGILRLEWREKLNYWGLAPGAAADAPGTHNFLEKVIILSGRHTWLVARDVCELEKHLSRLVRIVPSEHATCSCPPQGPYYNTDPSPNDDWMDCPVHNPQRGPNV